jgi:hypothetical protein
LHGSPSDIADTLRAYRDRYGVSYITVMEFHAQDFAEVIAQLRRSRSSMDRLHTGRTDLASWNCGEVPF